MCDFIAQRNVQHPDAQRVTLTEQHRSKLDAIDNLKNMAFTIIQTDATNITHRNYKYFYKLNELNRLAYSLFYIMIFLKTKTPNISSAFTVFPR